MTVLPVIARELRASARQPFTYTLRLLGVAALLLPSLLFGLHVGFEPAFGRELFRALHSTLFGAIWVLVPMLTADCISRERREGTLGLLFLTPLKGTDIVVAKGLAHGLRALTLGLAVLPVLAIPFLLGGVGWTEAALSVIVNANAMLWALAAGLVASAWSKTWAQAIVGAAVLALASLFISGTGAGWFLLQALRARWDISLDLFRMCDAGFSLFVSVSRDMAGSPFFGRLSAGRFLWVLGQTTLFSLLGFVAGVLVAGAKTRRSWREEPPSRRVLWLRRTFCTPVLWRSFFRRWMRRKLERNPIGWLEQRTWSGRVVTWAWLAVLVSVYSAVLTDRNFFREGNPIQETMAWLLAGSLAAGAAGSFRRERESGVLELLLVSPLSESRIIAGRLRGLWGQFLPAGGMLLVLMAYCSTLFPTGSGPGALLFFAVMFLSVPVFGLYFSLRCRNFIAAFLATVVLGLLLPLFLAEALRALWWAFSSSQSGLSWRMRPSVGAPVCQCVLAVFCWNRLLARLKKRAFPLERTQVSGLGG